MTELTPYAPQTAAVTVADYQSKAVQRLGEWAESARAAHAIAQSLVRTSFVPQAFRDKADEATAAILSGAEVGLQPMAALKSFDVIQGQAAPRALALRAIVQSFGHEIILEESTATRCRMKGRRRGSDEWQRVAWTIDRARDLGLTGKDNWKKQPQAMLMARATSEIARLIAADAILGIGYTVEEIADGAAGDVAVTVGDVPLTEPTTRTLSRKRTELEPAPEPDDEPQDAEVVDEHEPDGITDAQTRKMGALMRELHLGDRDDALRYVAETIGREVASRSELTKAEASQVIDALESMRPAHEGEAS